MSFKEVSSLDAEVTTPLGGTNKKTGKKNPTSAEGYYLGSRTVANKNGNSQIHFLQTPKGNLGVWGKTDMDRKLGAVKPGTMVRISFTGMTPTPRGDMYKFKVEVDDSNTIEVETAPTNTANFSEEGSDADETEENDDTESAGNFNDEDASQNTALAALERKNKVEALLKGNKNKR